MSFKSKLPKVETSIFSVMSKLAIEHNALNISQGFPDYDCDDKLKKLVSQSMKNGHNQYAPMPGIKSLRNVISDKAKFLYDIDLDPITDVTITAGATQAIYDAIATIVCQDDEVIVIEPAYDSYIPTILIHGGIPVSYELSPIDYSINWDDLKALITDKTKLIIINTPHNPTGKVISQIDINAINEIAKTYDLYFLFDEVYEHLIFDGKKHLSALLYPEIFRKSFVIYSFGKAYHNTGWKIGYCIAPDYLTQEFRKIHQFNVFSVNNPAQHALAEYMKDKDTYLTLNSFYQEKRDYFEKIISDTRFTPIKCEGTYFQLVSYADISDEDDMSFSRRITKEYGVASIPISPFYQNRTDNKVIRFCFAKSKDLMDHAAERLIRI